MKIVFMGTPDFAKESLDAIYKEGFEIEAVVTNPDKPKGRGMKMIASDVKNYALEKNIQVLQPLKIKNNFEFIEQIKQINPDVICVVAYGKILPKEILEIPKLGCINVHASILPKYRGAAPIQWAVINGDKTTGVSTMYMDIGMDTGDIILTKEVSIGEDETTGELWDRLSVIGGELLVETLKQIKQGIAPRIPQESNYTMAPMLNKQMAQIDWENMTSKEIKNLVNGLNPIMGAYSVLNDKKIKFWKVREVNIESKEKPGTIIESSPKKGLIIKTKDTTISVIEIQGENAKKMNISDYLRGNELEVGNRFEYVK